MAASLKIYPEQVIATVQPEIYGHFAEHLGACVEEGVWVGEGSAIPNQRGLRLDVINAFKKIRPPVMRWPGGCFADNYHWEDGVGPRAARPRRVNMWWGHAEEPNCFGTHEFIDFCRLIGAQPYFSANVGSGTVREAAEWVEYCNFAGNSTMARRRAENGAPDPFGVHYWGVGNENWGCGGNFTPETYAAEYRRFATYMTNYSNNPVYLIACGPDATSIKDHGVPWTQRFFQSLGAFSRIKGFSAHFYTGTGWTDIGKAAEFSAEQYYNMLHHCQRMEDVVRQHRAIMDGFDPQRKIGLIIDEWGAWHREEPGPTKAHLLFQQNTMRDALLAALTLDIFNRHADKVVMANIAQAVNVLQALVLTHGEKMVLTPTYHVYDMYQHHQGGQSVTTRITADSVAWQLGEKRLTMPALAGSATCKDKTLTLSVTNVHATEPVEAEVAIVGSTVREAVATTLAGAEIQSHNGFGQPGMVAPAPARVVDGRAGTLRLSFPAHSVTVLQIQA